MGIRLALLITVSLVAACSKSIEPPAIDEVDLTFVGSEGCASCHDVEFREWQGSHHQLAMQVAASDTVLGNFNNASLEYNDATSRFLKDGVRFVVETSNEAGEIESFEITHTFGVTPLQQYLVDMPGGRKQALPFAWDARAANDGGQRWYHLYPDDEVDHEDPLHWTGPYFNWNFMCAECHSTNLQASYDPESNTFHTTYDEISVGCEACHGPGSRHIRQAKRKTFDADWGLPVNLNDQLDAAWIMDLKSGIAKRSLPNTTRQQPESCGRCHSRRSVITSEYEYGKPLSDTHRVSLLDEHLYHPDGRIQEEVYVYGSFVQSKMYAAGVTCSDCHNAHSGELHAGPDPNDTCAQCHLTSKFASSEHSATNDAQCVDCHMPATTYMGVDDRRDHSFRLPATSTDPDHYGAAILAGRAGNANAQLLNAIANDAFPAIARATMITLLEPGHAATQLVEQFNDPNPLVRIAALRAIGDQLPESERLAGSHLLRDPVRGVRLEAALFYADNVDLLPLEDARAFNIAADEYRDALLPNTSMPEAALSLAEFELRMDNDAAATKMYEHAVLVGPTFAPAHHAYALSLVRAGQSDKALQHLHRAFELEPEVPRYAYVLGVALNSLDQSDEAIAVLGGARERFEDDFDIAWALATIYRDRGEQALARSQAEALLERYPDNAQVEALLNSLKR